MEFTPFEKGLIIFDRTMSKIETVVAVGCISVCGCIFLFSIINRLWIHMPLRWTEEACRMLLVLTVFAAQPIVTRERSHLKLAFLAEKLQGTKAERVLSAICDFSLMVIFGIIFWLFLQYTLTGMKFVQYSPGMGFPMWIMYGLCTIAFLDALVRSAMMFWNDNISKKNLFPRGGEDFSVN